MGHGNLKGAVIMPLKTNWSERDFRRERADIVRQANRVAVDALTESALYTIDPAACDWTLIDNATVDIEIAISRRDMHAMRAAGEKLIQAVRSMVVKAAGETSKAIATPPAALPINPPAAPPTPPAPPHRPLKTLY